MKYRITLDGKTYEMEVERIDGVVPAAPVAAAPATPAPAVAPAAKPAAQTTATTGAVTSPMPGTVLRLMALEGESVKKGQPILVLEAMKMENEISASSDGVLKKLYVQQGETVQGGAPLFEIG